MPIFAAGCHSSGQDAGSAPKTNLYWFENVLVSLAPDICLMYHTEAAIAKVVEFGIGEGKLNFHAVVFSVVKIIMLEVSMNMGTTHIERTETTVMDVGGFISVIHFFNVAATRNLFGFGQGCFPTVILQSIQHLPSSL